MYFDNRLGESMLISPFYNKKRSKLIKPKKDDQKHVCPSKDCRSQSQGPNHTHRCGNAAVESAAHAHYTSQPAHTLSSLSRTDGQNGTVLST